MIRQFIKDVVADLTNAVARSELAAENARLRAERDKAQALVKDLRDKYEYYGRKFREVSEDRDDLRAKLEVAERRQPVDRIAALQASGNVLAQWGKFIPVALHHKIVDAVLGAAKAEPEKRCTSVSLGGNRCCKEAGHSGLCSTKSGGVSWDAPDLGAAPLQPHTFTPAPTSEEPSTELVERMAKAGFEAFSMSTRTTGFVWSMAGEGRKEAERAVGRAIYALIAADHAAAVKRGGELEKEVARLSAPCPADGMDAVQVGQEIHAATVGVFNYMAVMSAMGRRAVQLCGRVAK